MKANMFMPKYMLTFKCIGSECVDTCCAGWDINIDEDKYSVICSVSLGDFFEEFNMKEEVDDFEVQTVNGWVIKEFGYLPKVGESFVYRDLSISISKIEERRVKEIIVERIEEQKCS